MLDMNKKVVFHSVSDIGMKKALGSQQEKPVMICATTSMSCHVPVDWSEGGADLLSQT